MLRVEPHDRTESYTATILLWAPDRGDVAFLNLPWRNWSAMLALARQVQEPRGPQATWRFETSGSRGVVTTHTNHGILRHVVYAYSYAGEAVPTLLFTRVRTETLLEILSSIELAHDD